MLSLKVIWQLGKEGEGVRGEGDGGCARQSNLSDELPFTTQKKKIQQFCKPEDRSNATALRSRDIVTRVVKVIIMFKLFNVVGLVYQLFKASYRRQRKTIF